MKTLFEKLFYQRNIMDLFDSLEDSADDFDDNIDIDLLDDFTDTEDPSDYMFS